MFLFFLHRIIQGSSIYALYALWKSLDDPRVKYRDIPSLAKLMEKTVDWLRERAAFVHVPYTNWRDTVSRYPNLHGSAELERFDYHIRIPSWYDGRRVTPAADPGYDQIRDPAIPREEIGGVIARERLDHYRHMREIILQVYGNDIREDINRLRPDNYYRPEGEDDEDSSDEDSTDEDSTDEDSTDMDSSDDDDDDDMEVYESDIDSGVEPAGTSSGEETEHLYSDFSDGSITDME